MRNLTTENFVLNYQEDLEEFIQDSLTIFDSKKTLITNLFGDILNQKIKASFFTNRDDFVEYIKSISKGNTPPTWATGCFYNGEIQALININDINNLESKKHTLTHEFVHLCFNEFIYDKYAIDRIRWLDESFAVYVDGRADKISQDKLKSMVHELKKLGEFDVNVLNDKNKIKTETYDGYDMFLIIGKYIFANNLAKKYLNELKTNPTRIVSIGKNILSDAINYVESFQSHN